MSLVTTCSITIPFYSDAGHGWAKVHLDLLEELGIRDKITSYSYMRGDYAYLEEDCDVSTLFKAAEAKGMGIKWKQMKPANNYSRIRSYDPYRTSNGGVYVYQW